MRALVPLLFLIPALLPAQRTLVHQTVERRLALVIGNNSYSQSPLQNAVPDAKAIAGALTEVGFEVTPLFNATREEMENETERFASTLRTGDVALFFFAGHGVELGGENYMIPTDFAGKDIRGRSLRTSFVVEELERSPARLKILVLDACRNNPYKIGRGGGRGLALIQSGRGSFIAFSAAPGEVADDNAGGRNGLFTTHLLTALTTPNLTLEEVFSRARQRVYEASKQQQLPWTSSSVIGEFRFRPAASVAVVPLPEPPSRITGDSLSAEVLYWQSIQNSRNRALFESYLRRYPEGQFAEIAKDRLDELRLLPVVETPKREAPATWTDAGGLPYKLIPAGVFQMGCSEGDMECQADEKPRHEVTISKPFWMGQTEVTVGAYKRFAQAMGRAMPTEPPFNAEWEDAEQPMVNIDWNDAGAYCAWAGGRLPTEAEWEWAARGGVAGARYGALDEVAWHQGNSGVRAQRVGQKKANAYGLHDMLGNVWEWVGDWYGPYAVGAATDPLGPSGGRSRVARGGSWYGNPRFARVSYRFVYGPALSSSILGSRCVREH